ncbi:MAG TPA: hypothetical protein VMK66_13395 [Myxococcales bacterium]|nr:hypothetical protein [Myxococcales bacterium]
MRRILVLSLLGAAACSPTRSELVVYWTFGGSSCSDAGVTTIAVDIAGEVLTPNQFSCKEASQGASLGFYLDGDYQLTVSGYDASGDLAYQSTQTLTVRGGTDNTFSVDVAPVATASVTLHWTFAGKSCAQAGIAVVHASVDGQVLTDLNDDADLPCTSGGIDGTTISPLSAGRHTIDLIGVDGTGASTYAVPAPFTATVVAGQDALYTPNLLAFTSTEAFANLSWTFGGKSCAGAAVDQVTIFVDPDANGNGGVNAGTVPCNTSGTDGASVSGLDGGKHSFAIVGSRVSGGTSTPLYRTHQPLASLFAIGLTTEVLVSAESLP